MYGSSGTINTSAPPTSRSILSRRATASVVQSGGASEGGGARETFCANVHRNDRRAPSARAIATGSGAATSPSM
jgi:hypothetical protein